MREWFKLLREKNKFSQQDVAEKLNKSRQYINLIENGERQKDLDLSLVIKLAKIFGVSVDYIIAEEEKLRG